MKAVLLALGVGFVSALIPVINIEAYLTAATVVTGGGSLVLVAASAALGATAGKVVLYYGAEWALNLPWMRRKMAKPSWAQAYAKWSAWVAERPRRSGLLVLLSAAVGIPPLLVITILAGQLRFNIWVFTIACFIGRWARFLVIVGAVDWFNT